MRFLFLLSALTSFVCAQIAFVNPEPAVPDSPNRNYQLNPTYVIGSSLLIQWTSPSNSVSMVLYQEREGDQFEYVFTNSVGINSFRWNVGTQKNLADGAVFFFQIFITGETSPSASSRYFNLTRGREDDDSASSTTSSLIISSTSSSTSSFVTSSSLSTTETTALTTTLATSTTATSGTGTASSSAAGVTGTALAGNDNGNTASSGLSTGAKIGLGVGIPLGVIALAALAFLIYRRRKAAAASKEDYTNTVPPNTDNKYTPPGDGSYAPNAMAEQGGGYYKPDGTYGGAQELFTPGNGTPGTMRSELANTAAPAGAGHGEVHEMSGVRY